MPMYSLITVNPWYEVSEAYYCNVMPLQQLLSSTCHISGKGAQATGHLRQNYLFDYNFAKAD